MNDESLITDYINRVSATLSELPGDKIESMVGILHQARVAGKRVFIMGNGGSAATASHFASDLNKGATCPGWPRFKAMALTDNMPVISAWANDSAYEDIFAQQLENHLEAGDIVVGISGSGNSSNIVSALKLANARGAVTLALAGFDGGEIKDIAHVCLVVPNNCMEQVEDIHLILGHIMTTCLRSMGVPQ